MGDYTPYLILAAIVGVAVVHRRGGLGRVVGQPTPRLAAAPNAVAVPSLGVTSADLFAHAHRVARTEAESDLVQRLAREAVQAAVAGYQAPFSPPSPTSPSPTAE